VVDSEVAYRPRRQLIARVRDAGGALLLALPEFLSQPAESAAARRAPAIFGEVHEGYLGPEIIHPRFHLGGEPASRCPRG
jgi:ATP-dependent DNA helicase RecG